MGPIETKGIILGLAVLAGVFCMWMGYRLYRTASSAEKGSFNASGGGFKVALKNYGPGTAFCLFGAILIVFAVTRDLKETTVTEMPDGTSRSAVAAGSRTVTTETGSGPRASSLSDEEQFNAVNEAASPSPAAKPK